jgi:hypothetical protein
VTDHPVLAELLERCRAHHAAWINGDGSDYALPVDGTIMGAVGGYSLGGAETAAVANRLTWPDSHRRGRS